MGKVITMGGTGPSMIVPGKPIDQPEYGPDRSGHPKALVSVKTREDVPHDHPSFGPDRTSHPKLRTK